MREMTKAQADIVKKTGIDIGEPVEQKLFDGTIADVYSNIAPTKEFELFWHASRPVARKKLGFRRFYSYGDKEWKVVVIVK